ncbi:MAG: hypothetical protein M3Q00_02115, partial [Pseudomonadota bacterium]|nr:hypothetical protein [Pseudomonadota bacterium]
VMERAYAKAAEQLGKLLGEVSQTKKPAILPLPQPTLKGLSWPARSVPPTAAARPIVALGYLEPEG